MEDQFVCFDEKQAKFRVEHINFTIFQHPTVGSKKCSSRAVGASKYAPDTHALT